MLGKERHSNKQKRDRQTDKETERQTEGVKVREGYQTPKLSGTNSEL